MTVDLPLGYRLPKWVLERYLVDLPKGVAYGRFAGDTDGKNIWVDLFDADGILMTGYGATRSHLEHMFQRAQMPEKLPVYRRPAAGQLPEGDEFMEADGGFWWIDAIEKIAVVVIIIGVLLWLYRKLPD